MRAVFRLRRYLFISPWLVAFSIVGAIAQAALLFPVALLVRAVFDTILPRHRTGELLAAGLLMLAAYSAAALVAVAIRALSVGVSKHGISRLRQDLADRVLSLPRSSHTSASIAGEHSALVHDTERVDMMANALLVQVLPQLAVGIALTAVLAVLNPLLTLAMLMMLPLLWMLHRLLAGGLARRVAAFHDAFDAFSRRAHFMLRALDLVRIQGASRGEAEVQSKAIEQLRESSRAMVVGEAVYAQAQATLLAASTVVILVGGGFAVMSGGMTVGALVAFYVTVAILRTQVGGAVFTIPNVVAGRRSAERLVALLDRAEAEPYRGQREIPVAGNLELRGVTFGYGAEPVLRDVTLLLEPGRSTALVGPNGAGKTSVLQLLLGFYRPWSGSLWVDGVAYDEVSMNCLRGAIGVVPQAQVMFDGTVRENLTYGHPDAPAEAVEAALDAAGAGFVRELDGGLDATIGEGGVLLSGGERQRVAVARALLGRPPILALDEPTTHLDAASVKQLLETVRMGGSATSVLVITHDPDVAASCDQVLYLDGGEVVARDRAALARLVADNSEGRTRRRESA